MIVVLTRTSSDVRYLTDDAANEIDGLRDGGPEWWVRSVDETTRTAADVLRGSSRSRVVGYDLVMSAPRAVSALMALDEVSGSAIVAAHRAAVAEAVDYLARRATVHCSTRRGEENATRALLGPVVSFTHGINRAGEPHLHDHVLVGSGLEDRDGVVSARHLRYHVRAADALYRSRLRHSVNGATPWTVRRPFAGSEVVEGLDAGAFVCWSGERARGGSKLAWTRDGATSRWRRDLAEAEPIGVDVPRRSARLDHHVVERGVIATGRLFRRDIVGAVADAWSHGARSSEVEALVDAALAGRLRGSLAEEAAVSGGERVILASRLIDGARAGRHRTVALEREP